MAKSNHIPPRLKSKMKELQELVSKKGLNKSNTLKVLGLNKSLFTDHPATAEIYEQAMAIFIDKILMKSVVDNLDSDSLGRKTLMQNLRVFDNKITLPHPRPKTIQEGEANLDFALAGYLEGEVSEIQLSNVRRVALAKIELRTAGKLEQELAEIKALLLEQGLTQ